METVERATRKSVPMSERDVRDLAVLRRSPSHGGVRAVRGGLPITESTRAAAVLHAVWEAGLKAVLERVEDEGYAQLASERRLADRKAVARRRRPLWAEES
jgi:hypothetical protein